MDKRSGKRRADLRSRRRRTGLPPPAQAAPVSARATSRSRGRCSGRPVYLACFSLML